MTAVPGTAWRRGHAPVRGYADQNRPVLGRGDVERGVIRGMLGSARADLVEAGSRPDDHLRTVVSRWVPMLAQGEPTSAVGDAAAMHEALDADVLIQPGEAPDE